MSGTVENAVGSSLHVEQHHLYVELMRTNVCIVGVGDIPIAINNSLRGLTMFTIRSVYAKTAIIMSSSVSGAGFESHKN